MIKNNGQTTAQQLENIWLTLKEYDDVTDSITDRLDELEEHVKQLREIKWE